MKSRRLMSDIGASSRLRDTGHDTTKWPAPARAELAHAIKGDYGHPGSPDQRNERPALPYGFPDYIMGKRVPRFHRLSADYRPRRRGRETPVPQRVPRGGNHNKKLRKIGPRMPNSMPQSFLVVNGAWMARAGHEPARNRPLTRNQRQNQPAGKPPRRGRRARRMRAWELARRTGEPLAGTHRLGHSGRGE